MLVCVRIFVGVRYTVYKTKGCISSHQRPATMDLKVATLVICLIVFAISPTEGNHQGNDLFMCMYEGVGLPLSLSVQKKVKFCVVYWSLDLDYVG